MIESKVFGGVTKRVPNKVSLPLHSAKSNKSSMSVPTGRSSSPTQRSPLSARSISAQRTSMSAVEAHLARLKIARESKLLVDGTLSAQRAAAERRAVAMRVDRRIQEGAGEAACRAAAHVHDRRKTAVSGRADKPRRRRWRPRR